MKSGRKFRTMTFLAEHNPKHSFLILIPPASLNGRESAKRRQKSSDRKRHSFSLSMISTRIGLQQPMTLQPLALRLRHCHAPGTGRKASCTQFPGEKSPRFGVWGLAERLLVSDCADRPNTFDADAGTHQSRRPGDCGLGQLAPRALCPSPLARSATFPFFIPACGHTQPRPQTRAPL